MSKILQIIPTTLFSPNSWRLLAKYTGLISRRTSKPQLDNLAALAEFLNSRASHVAQTSLFGYMKTRAGTRFPELFESPAMLASINRAKWQVWLACLSDLAVYSGVLMRIRTQQPAELIHALLTQVVARVLEEARSGDADDDDFAAAVPAVTARVANCDFDALGDDDSAFTESPQALVHWSPVADELKQRDAAIIRNSVRFRWLEIRRDLRKQLCADALARVASEQPNN